MKNVSYQIGVNIIGLTMYITHSQGWFESQNMFGKKKTEVVAKHKFSIQ